MGTCYSKNTSGIGSSPESKIHKLRNKNMKGNRKLNADGLSLEKSPFKESEEGCEETADLMADGVTSRSHVNPGVVPSDSGIESVDNNEDDVAESAQLIKEKDKLVKNGDLRSNSCHKSSNHNLSPIVSKTNNNHFSGEKRGESCTVNLQSESDDKNESKCSSTMYRKKYNPQDRSFSANSTIDVSEIVASGDQFKSASGKFNSTSKSASLDKSAFLVSDSFNEDSTINKAPLAAFDSIEANLDASPPRVNLKRQSLLSEILDITQYLCKSDFYPSEVCTRNHRMNGAVTEASNDALNPEIGASGQFEITDYIDVSATTYKGESLSGSSVNCSQKFGTPSKKGASLPKNVSFAAHEESSCEALTEAANAVTNKPFQNSRVAYPGRIEAGILGSPMSECTHKTASESILSHRQKEFHKRSASLGSVRALMSDSISDAPNCGTEDDVGSLDLDSVSRATSLSYGSIRQLVESTEDLVSRQYITQTMTIDGVECVVISAETYSQMQMDINTLKYQLLNLSVIMQEAEVLEES